MAISARSYPTDDLAVVPYWLVADAIGIGCVNDEGNEPQCAACRFFFGGGFAEVTPERCTILADEATPVAQLSRADAEARVRDAEAAYTAAAGETPEKRDAVMARLLSARAMLQAAQAA
jgi:F-type H+-transporting ATPase subunit epsilon